MYSAVNDIGAKLNTSAQSFSQEVLAVLEPMIFRLDGESLDKQVLLA